MTSTGPRVSTHRGAKGAAPLRLAIRASEAASWPGLAIGIHALHSNGRIPLDELQSVDGAFCNANVTFAADPLDALLMRTVRQLPKDSQGLYAAGPREFARVLALLRQASSNCELIEEGRVRQLEVLDEPPQPVMHISPAEATGDLQIVARANFRCAETGRALGWPVARDLSYWTFEHAVTPPPRLPDDSVLRGIFQKVTNQPAQFAGTGALDLLSRARANSSRIALHIDPRINAQGVNLDPLREKISVHCTEAGEVEVVRALFTASGKPVPFPESQTADGWLSAGGTRYRLPENFSSTNLCKILPPELPRTNTNQARHLIEGDAIPAFVLDVLPKLKALGANVASEVEALRVCQTLRPVLRVETDRDAGAPERVRASFYFEPAAAFRKSDAPVKSHGGPRVEITPVEILAAAAQGKKYLRHGDDFFHVDRELVAGCRKKLEEAASAAGSEFEAEQEQIPRLLAWARKAAQDDHTPWNCYIAESVEGAHRIQDEPAAVRVQLDVDEDEEAWFTLNATFDHGGVQLSEEEMRKLAKEGREWFLKNGTWIRLDREALKRFDANLARAGVKSSDELPSFHSRRRRRQFYYRFRPAERERVTNVFSIAGTIEHNERYKKFLDQLLGFESVQPLPLPKSMTLTPRPYQQKGFEWLAFLARYGLNGVLADDMGLGKTAQTIAQLTRMKEEFGAMPSLIVTPTSLADNWRNEIEKFSPGLRVMIYRGSPGRRDKLREEISGGYDVIIATLGTVRNDVSLLRAIAWRYVVIDEAHFIKNPAAGVAKAVKTIPAQHKLALTGTPIQNRLTELWSLFDFLMPGFLGRQAHFTQQYEEPILRMQSGRAESQEEHQTGKDAAARLRERIYPFVLRRLKTDVATDLPPKIESDIFCELTAEQTSLYKQFGDSDEARRAVSEIMEKRDSSSPAILAALMALRKICNHPDLLYLPQDGRRQHVHEPIPGYENRSGKLDALGELLDQCREGGHRALIFCQLTSMLDMLGHFLKKKEMSYLRIDGETPGPSRQKLVQQFNGDAALDAFLISTRAGGTGLNLTGADTVIFYDHDWNPANDQQAQDRAYRIGQTRTVTVYRLICKGTLEEKILRRQALKKALAGSIVTHDVSGMKDLSREELLSLFTLGE